MAAVITPQSHPLPSTFEPKSRTLSVVITSAVGKAPPRKRRLSPTTGRAIEILGHAIEYLHDELTLDCITTQRSIDPATDSRIASIELLKALNREIYLSCPVIPTLRERLWSMFEWKACW